MLIHSDATKIAVNAAAEVARTKSLSTPKTSGNHDWGWAHVEGTGWDIGVKVQGSSHSLKYRWSSEGPAPTSCPLPTPAGY